MNDSTASVTSGIGDWGYPVVIVFVFSLHVYPCSHVSRTLFSARKLMKIFKARN